MPTTVLVRKAAGAMGAELSDEMTQKAGMLAHYAFGAAGGPAAIVVRRAGWSPVKSGLAVATAMEIAVDQGMNYMLHLTPGPNEWPWQAHARGAVAHLAYGLSLGLMLAAGDDGRTAT